jgi:hypothetical protein
MTGRHGRPTGSCAATAPTATSAIPPPSNSATAACSRSVTRRRARTKNARCSGRGGGCRPPRLAPVAIGSRRELFVDRLLVDRLDGATLKLHEPVSGGTAIRIDKPWEGPANGGLSVIELDGRLLMYYRGWSLADQADENGVGCVAESRDGGATWTKPVGMTYGDSPREQFYINNTQPYFRAPHLAVAPAARFMEGRRVLDERRAQAIGLRQIGKHVYFKDCSDGVLLTSRAGSTTYDRTFMETFVRPGPGDSNWGSRTNYPLTGILPAGAGRMQLFVARDYMQPTWHVERLLLRTDGFASVSAPWAGGEMLTKPFTFAGDALEINYRTGAAGSVRIEITDTEGSPLAGFAAADGEEIIGDEIERVVVWKTGSDVASLAGKPVRLRFILADADVFSFRFR